MPVLNEPKLLLCMDRAEAEAVARLKTVKYSPEEE
jgi:hypothetical protein